MKTRPWLQAATILSALLLPGQAAVSQQPTLPSSPRSSTQRLTVNYAKLPLSFEANQGQTDPQVKFLSRGPGYMLFLTADEAVLRLKGPDQPTVLRMKLVDANPHARIAGLEPLPGKSNYFLGNDPAKWRTNVPHYARVRFEDVYPGIDLVYYGTEQGQLEYDFIVHPGADPASIRLEIDGADRLRISNDGDLIVHLPTGELRLRQPAVYQETEGGCIPIPGRYLLRSKREIAFKLATYDPSRALVIDPVLVYSTYLGGSGFDDSFGIAADADGNAYVVGRTAFTAPPNTFPVTPGAFQASPLGGSDAFVTKLNAAGTALVYSTFLGGTGAEDARGVAVDTDGNAYITGSTDSTDFPVTPGAFQTTKSSCVASCSEAFVTKLNPDGSALVYSTYLGGTNEDIGQGIALDASGNAYIAGFTSSNTVFGGTPFPTTPGAFQTTEGGAGDAFVTKLNSTGTALVYSTYLGASGTDVGTRIAVDSSGSAYVTGITGPFGNFPTTPGAFQVSPSGPPPFNDAFVTKLTPDGSALDYSTFLSGNSEDQGLDVAVDGNGNAYVTGWTESSDFPTANPLQGFLGGSRDVFLAKLNPSGSDLVYSTYLGGSFADEGRGIALSLSNNPYVAGRACSPEFPIHDAIQPSLGGFCDAFVTKLAENGAAIIYSTFLGGDGDDGSRAVAVDLSGVAYVTGEALSSDFPTSAGAFQVASAGSDAFVVRIAEAPNPVPALSSLSPSMVPATSSEFVLVVIGSEFVPDSAVRWNGNDRETEFVSSTELHATIPASDLAAAATTQVTVFNPAPGGGLSNALLFTITLRNPLPTVTSLSPPGAVSGSPGLMLTLNGSNFVFNSEVQWDGAPRGTTFLNSSQLHAVIPPTDLEMADIGAHQLTVFNPGPGGGTSNAATFNVLNMPNPAPLLASIDPTEVVAGAVRDTLPLMVNGSNFILGSIVRWNGMNRLTSFINANQLMATIPASDLISAGAASVSVFTPGPGGGTSLPAMFTLNNPAPTLNAINPNTAMVGDPAFTLTVLGSNFVPSSVVRWNGDDRPTTFIGSNQLRAAILASNLTHHVYVTNRDSNTVSVIDTTTNTVTTTIPVGSGPWGVAFTPDGRFAYVTNGDLPPNPPTIVSVIDMASNAVVDTVSVGFGPRGIAITPDGNFAYVVNQGDHNVSVIETATNDVVATIPVGQTPFSIAITPDGAFAYVVNGSVNSSSASVIDTATNTVVATIPVGTAPRGIAVRPDGQFAYVTNQNSHTVSVIDVGTNMVVDTISVSPSVNPFGIAMSPGGDLAYVTANPSAGRLIVIDTASNTVADTINVGGNPVGVAVTANGAFVYVTDFIAGHVTVVDAIAKTVLMTLPVGEGPCCEQGIAIQPGVAHVTVFNPGPGGGASNALPFTIELAALASTNAAPLVSSPLRLAPKAPQRVAQPSPRILAAPAAPPTQASLPVIDTLRPTMVVAGSETMKLGVTGENFTEESVVRWKGKDLPTKFIRSTELEVELPAEALAQSGEVKLTVFTPGPGGGSSKPATLTVTRD